jgi:TRAP-type uncharacterized transport system substrate-binding protein
MTVPALPVRGAEFGTRDDAVAMVRRVQAKAKKEGLEATIRAINNKSKEFIQRDLYPYIVGLDGIAHANPTTPPSMTGHNVIDFRDQDGKFFIRSFIAVAQGKGSGWVDYRWINPQTKTVEEKSAYIERLGNKHLIAVGVHKNEQSNENTIGIASGSSSADDTALQMVYDLAEVINDGGNLRVLPIAGIGGPRNIRDVRYVKGIDIGLTQTSILSSFRRSNERMEQGDNKIVYIAKLFNEEIHVIARSGIRSLDQLKGLKVNFDAKDSETSYAVRDIFKMLGIEVEEVSMSQTQAVEKVRSGEIAATALIAGKPVRSIERLDLAGGLHFVPIPFTQALIDDYLPTTLTHEDYPDLVPKGQAVDTIAVGVVLITYNWPKTGDDRYQRVEKFVEALFSRIDEFRKPPHHPKWKEVNLAAAVSGWTRFEAAQNWLDRQRVTQGNQRPRSVTDGNARSAAGPAQKAGLYQDFMRWRLQAGRP